MDVDFIFVNFDARKTNPFSDIALVLRYIKIIKKVNPDVILTYTIKPNIYGSIASRLFGKKTIINVTGLGSGFQTNKITGLVVKMLYKLGCSCAGQVFFSK